MKRRTLTTIMNVYGLKEGEDYQLSGVTFHDAPLTANQTARAIAKAIEAGEPFQVTTTKVLFGSYVSVVVCTQEGAR